MSTPEQAFTNLVEVKEILDGLEVPFWIDGGTLLGAYRDGDFCADDHNDVDLSVWADHKHRIPEIVTLAEAAGFRLYHHWTGDARAPGMAPEIALTRNGLKIDLFFFERRGENTWHLIYNREIGTAVVTPAVLLAGFEPIVLRGVTFQRPADIDGYLTHRYGDWRTPRHRSTYTSSDSTALLALDPAYEYWK